MAVSANLAAKMVRIAIVDLAIAVQMASIAAATETPFMGIVDDGSSIATLEAPSSTASYALPEVQVRNVLLAIPIEHTSPLGFAMAFAAIASYAPLSHTAAPLVEILSSSILTD